MANDHQTDPTADVLSSAWDAEPQAEAAPQKATVLLVDDMQPILDMLSAILESEGYDVLQATSGADALVKYGTHEIHAVVLDYKMPDIDGGLLSERLKMLDRRLPIVMFSGADLIPKSALRNVDALVVKGQASGSVSKVLKELLPRPA